MTTIAIVNFGVGLSKKNQRQETPMSLGKKSAAVILLLGCVGCAHIPDVTVGYYLARTKMSIKVVRTFTCDAAANLVVVNSVTPTTTHFADTAQFVPIRLAPLQGPLSDSDLKFDFYDDGRLKGVNATTTGQGESVLKAAIAVASTALKVTSAPAKGTRAVDRCADIKKFGGDKPLSLTYEVELALKDEKVDSWLEPDAASAFYAKELMNAIGGVCVKSLEVQKPGKPFEAAPGAVDGVLLKVRQPGTLVYEVWAGGGKDFCTEGRISVAATPVAQFGTVYEIPIPKAAAFGKQGFVTEFAESGSVKSVQYIGNTGAGQALNVINTGLTEIQNETKRKTEAANAEIDLIRAQQRLAQCKADPKSCS
jgi:hypothetical protein